MMKSAIVKYNNFEFLLILFTEMLQKLLEGAAVAMRNFQYLKDTYCGNSINIKNNESVSYKYFDSTWKKEKETNLVMHSGAGSIVSTPTEMVKFINASIANKLVSKSSLSRMETMVDDYGMGMFPHKYGSKVSFGHNGKIEEFYSALWYFPDEKLSFAYCTNGIDYPRTDILEGVLKICFNEQFTLLFSENLSLKSEELDKYLGKYSSGQIVVNCTKDSTKLLLETRGKSFAVFNKAAIEVCKIYSTASGLKLITKASVCGGMLLCSGKVSNPISVT